MPRQPLRVLLIDDYEPARQGLTAKLVEAGFRVVGEAGSIAVARSLAPRLDYDIALIDVYLPDGDGIELAAELRTNDANTTIVILTMSTKPNDLLRALRAGADGYLAKDFSSERLGEALRAAARGETPIARAMTPVLVREFQRQNKVRRARSRLVRERLTPREWQILTLLADGKSTLGDRPGPGRVGRDGAVAREGRDAQAAGAHEGRRDRLPGRPARGGRAGGVTLPRVFVRVPWRGQTPFEARFLGSDPASNGARKARGSRDGTPLRARSVTVRARTVTGDALARERPPCRRTFSRRIAFVWSCETRDSVTASTSPISRSVSSS